MSAPGFLSVMSFHVSEGETGMVFNICMYLAFPVSCLSTSRKVKKGLVVTHVSTLLSSVMSFYLLQTRAIY